MADYRYGDQGRSRSSIFSDDGDRWRGEQGYGRDDGRSRTEQGRGGSDDRGFFDRAGDEVRSWFGDEEAERRRESDARRHEMEQGETGRYRGGGHDDQWTGGSLAGRDNQASYGQGGYGRSSAYGGQGEYRQGYGQSGSSHHDESYRRWREQQIQALDREYDEYCRHRQQQFESEFSSFRQNRQPGVTQGGAGDAGGMMFGQGGQAGSTGTASQTGAVAGAATTGDAAGASKPGGRSR